MDLTYLNLFKKHYIFVVDDELGRNISEKLREVLGEPILFNSSIACGVYSSLQVLHSIQNKHGDFYPFDIGIIDVMLDKAGSYFANVRTIQDTMPEPLSDKTFLEVYKDTLPEVEKGLIENYFNFINLYIEDYQEKAQKTDTGGIDIVYAIAKSICPNAKFIINSASATLRSTYKILQYASKDNTTVSRYKNIIGIEPFDEYIENEQIYIKNNDYVKVGLNGFEGVNKISFSKRGILNPQNAEYYLESTYENKEIFPLNVFRESTVKQNKKGACVIHKYSKKNDGQEWEIEYELYSEFIETWKTKKPDFICILEEVIKRKIENREIDFHNLRTLLNYKGEWTIQIGEQRFENVPFVLAPIGGDINEKIRLITIDNKEKATKIYLFASFFLPWTKELLSEEQAIQDKAVKEIEEYFLSKYPLAFERVYKLGTYPAFHSFIEDVPDEQTNNRALASLEKIETLKIRNYLSKHTADKIETYLKDGRFNDYKSIKSLIEFYPNTIKDYFESYRNRCEQKGITLRQHYMTNNPIKFYADLFWIKWILGIIMNNCLDKAFDFDNDFEKVISYEIKIKRNPDLLVIRVSDNGRGFNVLDLPNTTSGFNSLLRAGEEKIFSETDNDARNFFTNYGKLYFESGNKKIELVTEAETTLEAVVNGTIVTLELYRYP